MGTLNALTLTDALNAVGVAQVFLGDATVAGGLVALGATEGEIRANIPVERNVLAAPEFTGGIAHDVTFVAGEGTVTVPVIGGNSAIWPKIMPHGGKGLGWSSPVVATPTTMLLIPRKELPLTMTTGAWTTDPPENAFWFWKVTPAPGAIPFRFAEGGKQIIEVTFTVMFDAAKPEGHKAVTIGDPLTATPSAITVTI